VFGDQCCNTRIARSDKRDTHPVIRQRVKEKRLAQSDLRKPVYDIWSVNPDKRDVRQDKGFTRYALREMQSEKRGK
jgi:hypothetical protein